MMTDPHDRGFRSFLRRSLKPFVLLLLLLSIGANVFLLRLSPLQRPSEGNVPPTVGQESIDTVLSPQAFGVVDGGFSRTPHVPLLSGGTISPVGTYVVTSGLLPALPSVLALYRDQGIGTQDAFFLNLFRSARVPLDFTRLQLSPQGFEFRTANGVFTVTLRLQNRLLTIRRTGSSVPLAPATSRAGDEEMIALARDTASQFGIESAGFASPSVADIAGTTVVRWPLRFSGSEVIDVRGQIVNALSVKLDRQSRTVSELNLNLLSPQVFARSDYPSASREELATGLLSGGLLPLSGAGLQGKPVTVTYGDADLVYVLRRGDSARPTYIVPAVRVFWEQKSTCQACGPVRLSTFVPALAPADFQWFIHAPAPAPVLSSSSSSVAPSAASGSGMPSAPL
ncbi:MAG: hypothetical protein WC840_00060 [Candidatus Peribacteraceae bacterium]